MNSKTMFFSAAGLQLVLFPMASYAQTSNLDSAFARQGMEARVSFTIPLGETSKGPKAKPRLYFGVRHYTQVSTTPTDWFLNGQMAYRDVSLGFTIEDTPRLMMNEQILVLPESDQADISTVGKIGLGVGAVVLVGVAALAIAIASCSDEPGGCLGDGE